MKEFFRREWERSSTKTWWIRNFRQKELIEANIAFLQTVVGIVDIEAKQGRKIDFVSMHIEHKDGKPAIKMEWGSFPPKTETIKKEGERTTDETKEEGENE